MADRPLILSIRFYYPPGDKRISHYHLWRAQPNGSGRIALTSGENNDYRPTWSPDGKLILFERVISVKGTASDARIFEDRPSQWCVIPGDGGPIRVLPSPERGMTITKAQWWDVTTILATLEPPGTPDQTKPGFALYLIDVRNGRPLGSLTKDPRLRDLAVSPNRKRAVITHPAGKAFVDLGRGAITPIANSSKFYNNLCSLWWDNETVVVVDGETTKDGVLLFLRAPDGAIQRKIPLIMPEDADGVGPLTLTRLPGPSNTLLISAVVTAKWNSRWFGRIDLATGKIKTIELGYEPVFSSDGLRFVGPGDRLQTDYGTKPGGPPHAVLTVNLIGGTVGAKPTALISGLVDVDACDWQA